MMQGIQMIFRKPETLHEAETRFARSGLLASPPELRKKIPILAIDDQNFPPQNNLANSGFKIETFSDIQRISDVEPYAIVLCDVNGVGANLSTDTQGAYVIEEIKKTYPDKVVIAYTAGSAMSKLVTSAKANADRYIRKDASIEEWRDLLDQVIRDFCNPIVVWKKQRLRLLNAGIDLQELLQIEQALVKNLGKGRDNIKSAIEEKTKLSGGAPSAWKKEVTGFLASKGFDFAFEYIFQ